MCLERIFGSMKIYNDILILTVVHFQQTLIGQNFMLIRISLFTEIPCRRIVGGYERVDNITHVTMLMDILLYCHYGAADSGYCLDRAGF